MDPGKPGEKIAPGPAPGEARDGGPDGGMIPLVDLRSQYRRLAGELEPAVRRVLAGGRYTGGGETARLEAEFAAYCGTTFAVACNSGTSALHLALEALGIGPGDEVIIPAMTFLATAAVVRRVGAVPVPADISPVCGTLDPAAVAARISGRTRAIIPVHLYGQPADMDALVRLARKHDLLIVEDAAQAHGAAYRGRRTGGLGDAGCFSFYPSKNLGACGEGGIMVTSRAGTAARARRARNWGMDESGRPVAGGDNRRMDEIQAAILRVKLRHLDDWNRARRAVASFYRRALAIPGLPRELPDRYHVYHIFALQASNRDRLRTALLTAGVQTGVHYPEPVHLLTPFANLGYRAGDFPVAERLAATELSLPIFPELDREAAARVVSAVRDSLDRETAGAGGGTWMPGGEQGRDDFAGDGRTRPALPGRAENIGSGEAVIPGTRNRI